MAGVKVELVSTIEIGVSGGTTKQYSSYTDSKGKFYLSKAYFSDPEFAGDLRVIDNGIWKSNIVTIGRKDAKLIGNTILTRDLQASYYETIDLTINISKLYNWSTLRYIETFKPPIGPQEEIFNTFYENQPSF